MPHKSWNKKNGLNEMKLRIFEIEWHILFYFYCYLFSFAGSSVIFRSIQCFMG